MKELHVINTDFIAAVSLVDGVRLIRSVIIYMNNFLITTPKDT